MDKTRAEAAQGRMYEDLKGHYGDQVTQVTNFIWVGVDTTR